MTNVCFAEVIMLGHGNGDQLGNQDGLVVIGSLVITRRSLWGPNSSCERLWVIHHDGVSKNQPVEKT
jgi:hypothetical protein